MESENPPTKKGWRESEYFKYPGSWLFYAIGGVAIVLTIPRAVLLLQFWLIEKDTMALFLMVSVWGAVIAALAFMLVGVKWVMYKKGAKYSLIVAFILAFASSLAILQVIGLINSYVIMSSLTVETWDLETR